MHQLFTGSGRKMLRSTKNFPRTIASTKRKGIVDRKVTRGHCAAIEE
jgi:hypothetical protein